MSRSGHNPVIPPRPDMAFISSGHGTTERPPPPPERTTSSSKTPVRKEPPPIPPHPDSDWTEREELRLRELEEARARAAQMEKTMRWWSDCTANWREKWSKVRNERNKVREECRQLRSKLETSVKDYCNVKRERNDLRAEVGNLKKLVDQYHSGSLTSQGQSTLCAEAKVKDIPETSVCSSGGSHKSGSDQDLIMTLTNTENPPTTNLKLQDSSSSSTMATNNQSTQEDFVSKLLSRKEKDSHSSSSSHSGTSKSERRTQKETDITSAEELLTQKVSLLQLKMEEMQKTLVMEREDKCEQQKCVDNLQTELADLQSKYEESRQSEQHALKEVTLLQQDHKQQLDRMTTNLQEESTHGDSMDRRVADLRKELERLQLENAQEWGKQERLETEKLSLERENKKIKKELELVEEELEKKNQQTAAMLDTDLKATQLAVAEKTREMSDLRHAYKAHKKVLQERTAELEHAKSRADQYESEVKKLRTRIDELKQELATSEDEVDQQTHQVRKLQRSNDELQTQVDNLNLQVQHLQSRLLRVPGHGRSLSHTSYDTNDSMTEGATDED